MSNDQRHHERANDRTQSEAFEFETADPITRRQAKEDRQFGMLLKNFNKRIHFGSGDFSGGGELVAVVVVVVVVVFVEFTAGVCNVSHGFRGAVCQLNAMARIRNTKVIAIEIKAALGMERAFE